MKKWLNRGWKVLVVLLLADLAGSFAWYHWVDHFLETQETRKFYDAGLVFFGRFDGLNMADDSQQRVAYALDFYRNDQLRDLICVGGARPTMNVNGAELMADYLIQQGVPGHNVYFDTTSYDTQSNWEEALKILKEIKANSVAVISSPQHVYRISTIIGTDAGIVNYFAPEVPQDSFDALALSWYDIHWEWVAFTMKWLLPDAWYDSLLRKKRKESGDYPE